MPFSPRVSTSASERPQSHERRNNQVHCGLLDSIPPILSRDSGEEEVLFVPNRFL
jgi:hypothetical protein